MGVDLGTKATPDDQQGNQTVFSSLGGVIVAAGLDSAANGGQRVWVQHDPAFIASREFRGPGLSTFYAHLKQDTWPPLGSEVGGPVQIAISDRTGLTTAPNLHFETWFDGLRLDPEPLLREDLAGYLRPTADSPDGLTFDFMFATKGVPGEVLVKGETIADPVDVLDAGQTVQTEISADEIGTLCGNLADCQIIATLRMLSPRVGGIRELARWLITVKQQVSTVHLNPFSSKSLADITGQPLKVEVINSQLQPTPAPQDITATVRREVISPCEGLLFSGNLTVVIPAGQSFGTFDSIAGRDPFCNTLPIVTKFTITNAVTSMNKVLDLSGVPVEQLSLSVTR